MDKIKPIPARAQFRGLTMIELLVALAVLAILLAIGLPAMQETLRSNRVSALSNDVLAAAAYARSEAVRRVRDVTACPSPNSTAATSSCSGADWGLGWIVFVDANGDGQRQAAEALVRLAGPADGAQAIGSSAFVLRFDRLGRTRSLAAATTIDVRSTPCAAGGPARRLLNVSVIGRVAIDPTIRFCP